MADNPFKYSVGTRVRDKVFLDFLAPHPGDKVLDVGCGLGYFTELFNRHGARCTGIDIDDLCLDYCRANIMGEYAKVDLTKPPYPFPSDSFHKVICSEVLEHIKENKVILWEIHRVMKPGGVLVVSTPCLDGVFGTFWKRIGHNSVNANSYEYHHHTGYTAESLGNLLADSGFKCTGIYYTMVLGVEVIMGITKVLIRRLQLKKIDSQANALNVDGMIWWRIYKKLFGGLLLYAKMEQPLSRVFKGHMIIMRGVLDK